MDENKFMSAFCSLKFSMKEFEELTQQSMRLIDRLNDRLSGIEYRLSNLESYIKNINRK